MQVFRRLKRFIKGFVQVVNGTKLSTVYGSKYMLDYQILTDHSVFGPRALYHDLVFELTLSSASSVTKRSDAAKLVYTLKNIQFEYEMI